MANTPSSKKDAKRSAVRAQRNRSIRSAVKTKVTKFRRGMADEAEGIPELATIAISALDRAVSKGVLHPNNAARRKSRVMKRLNESGQAPVPAAPLSKGSRSKAPASKAAAARAPRATRSRTSSKA